MVSSRSPSRRAARSFVGAASAVGALLAGPPARADDALDKAAAEAAFRDGVALLARGDVDAACPKLEAAVALAGGEALGGKLELARCWEKAGRLASAWALFLEVAARAQTAGQAARAADARAAAAAVEPRVPRIEVLVADDLSAVPGLELARQGKVVPRPAWAAGLPVDPGEVELTLRAGDRSAVERVTIAPGERRTVRFTSLEAPPDTSGATTPAAVPASPGSVPAPGPPSDDGTGDGQRVVGLVLGGAGVAAIGVGTVLALVAKGDYDAALTAERCAEAAGVLQCDDVGPIDDARGLGTVATVVGGVGLGLVAAGLVTFLVAPDDDASTAALAPHLAVGPGGAMVGVGGGFW